MIGAAPGRARWKKILSMRRCGMDGGCVLIRMRNNFSCAIDVRKKNTGNQITAPTAVQRWTVSKMAEYKCGDCIHADVCEEAECLVDFSRDNIAYCGMFLNAADVAPVVRCKDCTWFRNADEIIGRCATHSRDIYADQFCSYGERRVSDAAD